MARVKIAGLGGPGFVQDTQDYDIPPEAFTEVRNVRFNPKGAVTVGGHKAVMSPAAFNPLWLRVFPPIENPLWVYAGLTNVVAYNGGHVDITRESGPYTAITNQRWTGEVLNGIGIFNNTVDVPQMWSRFDASVKLVDLPNWPANLRTRSLRTFKNFLIALYTEEDGQDRPFRFRWSHPAAPGNYPASWELGNPVYDSGEKDIAETEDYLVDGLRLGDLFIIYKQRSVYAAQYVGRPNIFAHWPIIPNKGLLWRDCVQSFQRGHFVVGIDDIYVHNGQRGSEVSIVEAQLRDWIFTQVDGSNYFNCYTVNYARRNEIWFCFPEAGGTYPTICLIYNTITGGIGVKDLDHVPFIYPGPVETAVDDDIWDQSPIIEELNARLVSDGFFRFLEDGSTRLLED